MAAHTKKADEVANMLFAAIKRRLAYTTSTLIVTQSVDTDSNPTITINDGSAATTEVTAFIKVMPSPSYPTYTDHLGNSLAPYASPTSISVCFENAASGSALAPYLTTQQVLHVLGECIATGCVVEVFQETNGTVPTTSTIAASKKKGDFLSLWGQKAAQ